MGLKDFASKVASDALGRIIAQAPDKFISLMTSAAVVKVKVEHGSFFFAARRYLEVVGTQVYAQRGPIYDDSCGIGRNIIFLYRRQPIVLKVETEQRKDGIHTHTHYEYAIIVPRTFPLDRFIQEVWTREKEAANKPLTGFWESPAYRALERDLCQWRAQYAMIKATGLPWKRGWLLYGPPGNGKTLAVKQLSLKYGFKVRTINVAEATNWYLPEASFEKPCINLVEDIDDVIQGRQNVRDPVKGIAFSTILNKLDGFESNDCVLTVVTTNKLEHIDPALGRPRDESHWNQLSTRPGRLDRCVRFDNPDFDGRVAIGKFILPEDEAVRLAHEHTDVSVVQFQAICRERAFARVQDVDAL